MTLFICLLNKNAKRHESELSSQQILTDETGTVCLIWQHEWTAVPVSSRCQLCGSGSLAHESRGRVTWLSGSCDLFICVSSAYCDTCVMKTSVDNNMSSVAAPVTSVWSPPWHLQVSRASGTAPQVCPNSIRVCLSAAWRPVIHNAVFTSQTGHFSDEASVMLKCDLYLNVTEEIIIIYY